MSGKKLEMVSEWFSDAYWHWRNVFYFRFSEYNDNIDRLAFFEELCYGWHQMYSGEEYWNWDAPIPEGVDPYNLLGRDSYYTYKMKSK